MCKGVVGLMELDDTGAEVCVAHIQVPRLGGELVCPYVMWRNRKASDPSGRATLIPRVGGVRPGVARMALTFVSSVSMWCAMAVSVSRGSRLTPRVLSTRRIGHSTKL